MYTSSVPTPSYTVLCWIRTGPHYYTTVCPLIYHLLPKCLPRPTGHHSPPTTCQYFHSNLEPPFNGRQMQHPSTSSTQIFRNAIQTIYILDSIPFQNGPNSTILFHRFEEIFIILQFYAAVCQGTRLFELDTKCPNFAKFNCSWNNVVL